MSFKPLNTAWISDSISPKKWFPYPISSKMGFARLIFMGSEESITSPIHPIKSKNFPLESN
jgi:hypothetical protein